MRLFVVATVVLAAAVGCGPRPAPEPATTSGPAPRSSVGTVDPARIQRARDGLPPGYEVVDIDPHANPVSLWGFGPDWAADPPECGALPARETEPTRGWSASGPGGIVYAGVMTLAPGVPEVRDARSCGQWSVSGGHAVGTVTRVPAPEIDGAVTAGTSTAVTTVVEGGTETRSHADTFTATIAAESGSRHVFVTVVTDPGSPNPALDATFAADLLVKTVSVLRG
ncbi:hypothetical protein FR943_22160 [Mycobacterium sp. TNTM28]|uniref:DUF5642 domain-containing protein n=1 Tax=[Mycobacterium] fortunisiensis TaxID=2600579 RepID=A0ABS6KSR8_9MYCO|nr:DUF5642 family protein [[Mycobacterium] fortunisiensis]MBU9766534.1 hypothetical protein [[Mycobacterium] fortunisiensis]